MEVAKQDEFGTSKSGKTTIRFGGISTLGYFTANKMGTVWLLDVRGISGSSGHSPSLLVPGYPKVIGTPDSVVIFPEAGFEYGVWSLHDTEITVEPKKPSGEPLSLIRGDDETSVDNLVNVGMLAESTKMASRIRHVASLQLSGGFIAAVPMSEGAKQRKYNFKKPDGKHVFEKNRSFASQLEWTLDEKEGADIRLRRGGRDQTIHVPPGITVMMSNACFCDDTNDLLTHFEVVDGGIRPTLVEEKQPDLENQVKLLHENPFDIRCASGFVEFP